MDSVTPSHPETGIQGPSLAHGPGKGSALTLAPSFSSPCLPGPWLARGQRSSPSDIAGLCGPPVLTPLVRGCLRGPAGSCPGAQSVGCGADSGPLACGSPDPSGSHGEGLLGAECIIPSPPRALDLCGMQDAGDLTGHARGGGVPDRLLPQGLPERTLPDPGGEPPTSCHQGVFAT